MTRVFSTRNRPMHLGPYPLERLDREVGDADLSTVPAFTPVSFKDNETPKSIVNAMSEYQALLDAIRIGLTNKQLAECPQDLMERANHIKSFGYFCDASMVGISRIPDTARLRKPYRNNDVDRLANDLKTRQTKTLASGIDMIMADLRESMEAPPHRMDSKRTGMSCKFALK